MDERLRSRTSKYVAATQEKLNGDRHNTEAA